MCTLIIFDQMDAELTFFRIEGDFSHLHDIYINDGNLEDDDPRQDELMKLIFNSDGSFILPELSIDEFREHSKSDIIIVAGFLP